MFIMFVFYIKLTNSINFDIIIIILYIGGFFMTNPILYIHCWTCRHFKECRRRYTPEVKGEIYTKHWLETDENGETIAVFDEPKLCMKPLKTSKS